MIFTIYLTDRNHAAVRRADREAEDFWREMEFVHWYLIRVLSEFYESPQLLPDSLAAVYIDREFLARFLPSDDTAAGDLSERLAAFRSLQRECRTAPYARMTDAELDAELREEAREFQALIGEINSSIIQRPVILDRAGEKDSPKFIRAIYPECRVEFRGFGRFLGYSDINQILYWTPFLVLKHFYFQYIPAGGEILRILTAISAGAGGMHAARRITGENHRELAAEGIRSVRKKYLAA